MLAYKCIWRKIIIAAIYICLGLHISCMGGCLDPAPPTHGALRALRLLSCLISPQHAPPITSGSYVVNGMLTLRGLRTHITSAWGQATSYPSYAILDAQSGTYTSRCLITNTRSNIKFNYEHSCIHYRRNMKEHYINKGYELLLIDMQAPSTATQLPKYAAVCNRNISA